MVESKPSHFDEIKGKSCMVMKQVSNYNKLERLFSGTSLFLTTTMITSSRDSCSSGSNRRHIFHQKVVVASPLPGRAETTECGGAGYRGSYRNFDRSSSWISVTARSYDGRTRERSELTFTQMTPWLCGRVDLLSTPIFDHEIKWNEDPLYWYQQATKFDN